MENLRFLNIIMNHLLSVYIACTIFGVGVTVIDMLGVLGDLFHEGDTGSDGDGGHSDDAYGDHDAADGSDGGHESDDGIHFDHHEDSGHHGDHQHDDHGEQGALVAQDDTRKYELLTRLLSTARSAVHFSLGFGPVGVFAIFSGRSEMLSLAWSVPVGITTLVGGRILRRIQRSELDSQITTDDLIMERGKVLVSIGPGQLGKVRIHLESTYADRYARAQDPQKALKPGTPVRVVDVADDCVYVEEEI